MRIDAMSAERRSGSGVIRQEKLLYTPPGHPAGSPAGFVFMSVVFLHTPKFISSTILPFFMSFASLFPFPFFLKLRLRTSLLINPRGQ